MTDEAQAVAEDWFYEEDGQRKGAIAESELIGLIKSGKISYGASVWKKGFPDWLKIENTDLRGHLEEVAPPPLKGEHINNTVVWVLAFAPIIGFVFEKAVVGIPFITLILNIALSYLDEKRLRKAGHNTDKFKGWIWLVPVYLYQRAKILNQNLAYFIVWIVCFVLVLVE
jgi:hypothetical protein